MLVAIAVPSILHATQGERQSLEARVAAFKHENGDVEFAIQVKDGPEWGERLLPRSRTLNERSPTGRWLSSSSVTLTLPEAEEPAVAAVAETPDGHYRFDVTVTVSQEETLVVRAVIDEETYDWPTHISLSEDQLSISRQDTADRWGRVFCSQSATTPRHLYAPPDAFDKEALDWVRNDYNGFSLYLCEQRGRILLISADKWDTYGSTAGSSIFYPSQFRISIDQLRRKRQFRLPVFHLSTQVQDWVRQTPCTSDDVHGLPQYIGETVVGFAINSGTCRVVATRTLRVNADGGLYGRSGDRLNCRYSVEVTRTTEKFARVSYTFNQGCELKLVGGGNSETYYLVGDFWNSYSNRR
ncbi:MAG: hypothetical protein OXT70_02290 [Chloroflexota bacterium]|nr:hypothetical protein [Chloroflexota bacterium]